MNEEDQIKELRKQIKVKDKQIVRLKRIIKIIKNSVEFKEQELKALRKDLKLKNEDIIKLKDSIKIKENSEN